MTADAGHGLYVASQLAGGVDVLTYAVVVSLLGCPIVGLVIGTLVGMILNYLGARW